MRSRRRRRRGVKGGRAGRASPVCGGAEVDRQPAGSSGGGAAAPSQEEEREGQACVQVRTREGGEKRGGVGLWSLTRSGWTVGRPIGPSGPGPVQV
jgi:hypothetical protein